MEVDSQQRSCIKCHSEERSDEESVGWVGSAHIVPPTSETLRYAQGDMDSALFGRSPQQRVGAVIVAAGSSQRMDGVDKVWASLGGKPLLARVADVFQRCRAVNQVVIVLSERNLKRGQQLVAEQGWTKVTDVCRGGERRQDSVLAGLSRLTGCGWVVIHDGARPLVTEDLVERGLEAARETGAAVAAVPATDTIKLAGSEGMVRETLLRSNLWAVQTPQVFRFDIIEKAYRQLSNEVTDDAALVEQLGYRVKLYMGSYSNIKITTPDDLALARVLWRKYEKQNERRRRL